MGEIVLDRVDKIYAGGVKAVDSLSLNIRDGEFMVFVGPSGCGKSTALRMIAGLEEISGGTVRIGDRIVNDLEPKDRDIAMVFQNYALYPHLTVRQNLAFGLELRKTPKQEQERRVNEVARLLALDGYLDRKPAALSGGQRQRVAMGRAIVREPQAYLMDEPLSNLDAKLRVTMRAMLSQLHDRLGVTTVYVTHDQVEAMTLGDRVTVLRDGKLQQVDTPQNLFERPSNLFVAGFIGSPSMNFVEADLVRENGVVARFGNTALPVPQEAIDAHPGVDAYLGKRVILGVRPSDFESTTEPGVEGLPVIDAVAEVTEALGSEIMVLFRIDAPPVQHADATAAAHDREDQDAGVIGQDKALWTARVSPETRVRHGSRIQLAVDNRKMHFFDPTSGQAIGFSEAAQQMAASSPANR